MGVQFKIDTRKFERDFKKQVDKIVKEQQIEINAINRFEECEEMKMLNKVEEEMLEKIVECRKNDSYTIVGSIDIFPEYIQNQIKQLFKILQIGGYISFGQADITGGWHATITPLALTYFEDKKEYLEKENKKMSGNQFNIGTFNANGSNVVFGDLSDSTLMINSSISQIEKDIEEKGGEDKEELLSLMSELKDCIENIQTTKSIPKNTGLFTRLGNHFTKHQWFYASVLQLLGQVSLTLIGGANTPTT